jgi:hypothetical protein
MLFADQLKRLSRDLNKKDSRAFITDIIKELFRFLIQEPEMQRKYRLAARNSRPEQSTKLECEKVYLVSNTILKPAISLYNKLKFKKIVGHTSPYERCSIQMPLKSIN